jgi:hypothetical protein
MTGDTALSNDRVQADPGRPSRKLRKARALAGRRLRLRPFFVEAAMKECLAAR